MAFRILGKEKNAMFVLVALLAIMKETKVEWEVKALITCLCSLVTTP